MLFVVFTRVCRFPKLLSTKDLPTGSNSRLKPEKLLNLSELAEIYKACLQYRGFDSNGAALFRAPRVFFCTHKVLFNFFFTLNVSSA